MSQAELSPAQAHDAEHAHHDHPAWLAHHFDTPDQQNTSAKIGMWVFLGTEILMFGGLFCAYAIWRANSYDAFWIGHVYLSTTWGAINTVVLLLSSFTMAWAVRAAQLNQRSLCVWLLALTFLGGCGFMVIKAVEYTGKFEHGLGPGIWYTAPAISAALDKQAAAEVAPAAEVPGNAAAASLIPSSAVPTSAAAPRGMTAKVSADHAAPAHGGHDHAGGDNYYAAHGHTTQDMVTARGFFSIYFGMTALHGLHVLVGMGLMLWILLRARRGEFSAEFNTPVDLVGLYWHLVDLIWIFLFPLLYLI
jgi:cytochrome c oxidase subunit 3